MSLKKLDKDIQTLFKDLGETNDDTGMTLKRLDTDIQTLFEDLGETYKRVGAQKFHTEVTKKSENKKTYEKIEDNTVMIENLDHNFNSRIIGLRASMIKKIEKEIEKIRRFMKNHSRNVTDT